MYHSNDIAWDGESKRIIAVGDGKEKSAFLLPSVSLNLPLVRYGAAFMMDSGSSTGEIIGHSKVGGMLNILYYSVFNCALFKRSSTQWLLGIKDLSEQQLLLMTKTLFSTRGHHINLKKLSTS